MELRALHRAQGYATPPSPTYQHIIKNYSFVCVCECGKVIQILSIQGHI